LKLHYGISLAEDSSETGFKRRPVTTNGSISMHNGYDKVNFLPLSHLTFSRHSKTWPHINAFPRFAYRVHLWWGEFDRRPRSHISEQGVKVYNRLFLNLPNIIDQAFLQLRIFPSAICK